jgi:curli biogenesis system outer membrane secretion channel CsgG
MRALRTVVVVMLASISHVGLAIAEDTKVAVESTFPVAVLGFSERGAEVEGLGQKATDLLLAGLLERPEVFLVDREELNKVLQEQALNLSGAVNPEQAVKVGQLTGAKILVTGSILQTDGKLSIIAKIIGVETTRVVGASVKGGDEDELGKMTEQLAKNVAETIKNRSSQLVAKPQSQADRAGNISKLLGDAKRPSVRISIAERHVGQATIDPAAETEVMLLCNQSGFEVIDNKTAKDASPDVLVTGEAFSEFAGRVGSLVSVRARLEIKVVDRKTGKVLAADRQTTVAIDLSEQQAGKSALQEAGAILAERNLPKLGIAAK